MSYISTLILKLVLVVGIVVYLYGCAPVPYRVCDKTNACRNMTKAEAMEAAEVNKEWQNASQESHLKLGISKP